MVRSTRSLAGSFRFRSLSFSGRRGPRDECTSRARARTSGAVPLYCPRQSQIWPIPFDPFARCERCSLTEARGSCFSIELSPLTYDPRRSRFGMPPPQKESTDLGRLQMSRSPSPMPVLSTGGSSGVTLPVRGVWLRIAKKGSARNKGRLSGGDRRRVGLGVDRRAPSARWMPPNGSSAARLAARESRGARSTARRRRPSIRPTG